MSYLIAGLGNTGSEYELTRHNAGFLVLDRLAENHKADFEISRYCFYSKFRSRGKIIHLIKPTTFMNNSGKSVNYWIQQLKLPVEKTVVIVDDLSLPFGTIRLRAKGSSAGHNGLASIEQILGTQNYPRLRIGIGNDFSKGDQIDYVLSRFNTLEMKDLDIILDKACEVIHSIISVGIDKSMSQFNRKEEQE
jgi:PTH1 family peptidyl-tRNA hydrolase